MMEGFSDSPREGGRKYGIMSSRRIVGDIKRFIFNCLPDWLVGYQVFLGIVHRTVEISRVEDPGRVVVLYTTLSTGHRTKDKVKMTRLIQKDSLETCATAGSVMLVFGDVLQCS